MTVEIKETSATKRTLEITIPQADLKAPFEKKVNQYKKQVTLKGFRQGQVPKAMILKQFGESIRHEVVDETINKIVQDELKKANIIPVGQMKVVDFKDDKENDIALKVEVEMDPVIDIKGYADTGITVPAIAVSQEEIDNEYNRLMQMWSKDEHVDREAKSGDVVVGNYVEVIIDGEKQDLPENKEFRSLLGESASPGFDAGLVGAKAGEAKEVNFQYPEDHKDERYRGKTAQFKVEITDVREIVPPTMDEAFFEQVGVKDVEDLKKNLAEGIENQKKDAAKNKAINEAIDKIIEANPFEVPEARVYDLIRWSMNRNAQSEKDVVEPTEEQIKALSPEAVREIKKHRILDFVATAEKIRPAQADVDARLQVMANAYHVDFESLKNHFRQSGRINGLRDELRVQMAADFIVGIRPAAEENK
ncbi:trigger factor [Fibrobacter sp. UWH9]|uniref:trigger factor n=1 Tax=unclassified Fibrobacter TaxID=2634177 RepID=UPI0009176946|nr:MULTISPECIES: trigger factor [Fibrobacter]MCQ2098848.1 trigger factor [Fibrobacter sp.]MCL4102288.1 Trigger factor [Fibrobacter succinogenes]MDO4947735.1 trigger factor [Fibrobacter sp.]OWV03127.1 trigger factor [Fibrobacter sp. UWH3]SHH10012.1 trigger factor [Fibrobacter sp. UWH9]